MGGDNELNLGEGLAQCRQDALLPAGVEMLLNLIDEDNAVAFLRRKLSIETIQAHTTKGQIGNQGHHAADTIA